MNDTDQASLIRTTYGQIVMAAFDTKKLRREFAESLCKLNPDMPEQDRDRLLAIESRLLQAAESLNAAWMEIFLITDNETPPAEFSEQ